MKTHRSVKIQGWFLLLLYIFSNSPFIKYHHHNYQIADFEQANSCEKLIYFDYSDQECHHKDHIVKDISKCPLDDNHLTVPGFISSCFFNFTEHSNVKPAYNYSDFRTFLRYSENSNRGPPSFV